MYISLAKNTLFQLFARGASTFTTLFATLIIARGFGAQGLGGFTQIITVVGFFIILLDFGLNAIYLREDKEGKYFQTLLLLRLSLAVLFVGVLFVIEQLHMYGGTGISSFAREYVGIYALLLIPLAIIFSCNAFFQQRLQYSSVMLSSITGSLITFGGLWIAAANTSYELVILSFVAGAVATAGLSLGLRRSPIVPLRVDYQFGKKLLIQAFPLGLMLLLNLIYFRFDIILLSFIKTSDDVGIYGLAYRVFEVLIAMPLFLSNALYPTLLKNISVKKVREYIFLYFGLGVILTVIFWFASPLFSLIKEEFSSAVIPFRILVVGVPIFFATSILQWVLIALKQEKFLLLTYFLCIIVNVVSNIMFIPEYSYVASAVITGVTEGLVFISLLLKFSFMSKNMRKQTTI